MEKVSMATSDHPAWTDDYFTDNPESTENVPAQNMSSFFGSGGANGGPREEFTQEKVAKFLQKYGDGFVLIVGTVGNIAALVILLKKKFRSNVFNNYLIAFTIADIVFVVFDQGLAHWNEAISDFVFKEHSDFTCKLWTYVTKASYSYANWILAGINLNRAFAIVFPLKMKTLVSRRNNYLYLFISLFVIAVFEVYEIIGYEIIEDYSFGHVRRACGYVENPSPSLRYFNDKVVGWLYFVTSTLAPGFIILLCNGFIISTLLRRNKRRSQLVSRTSSNDAQIKSIILTLVAVSTAFVVLQAPFFYISLKFLIKGTYDWFFKMTPKEAAIFTLKYEASIFLLTLNHSINFVLYLIAGGEFRTEFMKVYCCCLCRGESSDGSIETPTPRQGKASKRDGPQAGSGTLSTPVGTNASSSGTGNNPSIHDASGSPSTIAVCSNPSSP